MLTVTKVFDWLPSRSVATPETVEVPSVVTTIGSGQEATPIPASVQSKETVTSLLFQPVAPGVGLMWRVSTGPVLSSLMVTDVVAWFPAASTAVPVTVVVPSVVTVTGDEHDAMPEPAPSSQ